MKLNEIKLSRQVLRQNIQRGCNGLQPVDPGIYYCSDKMTYVDLLMARKKIYCLSVHGIRPTVYSIRSTLCGLRGIHSYEKHTQNLISERKTRIVIV